MKAAQYGPEHGLYTRSIQVSTMWSEKVTYMKEEKGKKLNGRGRSQSHYPFDEQEKNTPFYVNYPEIVNVAPQWCWFMNEKLKGATRNEKIIQKRESEVGFFFSKTRKLNFADP